MSKKCYDCGVILTKENDSGWEVFTDKKHKITKDNQDYLGATAPLCIACDKKRAKLTVKKVLE